MEENRNKEPIDRDLAKLEKHTPSMRFAKNVVDIVKLETGLIVEQRNPIHWIPKLCIGGFALLLIVFLVVLNLDSSQLTIHGQTLLQTLRTSLVTLIGILAFLAVDRLAKSVFTKPTTFSEK